MQMKKLLLTVAVVLAVCGSAYAHTPEDDGSPSGTCAVVTRTDDGFLALRSDPSTSYGYRKAKLHAGDYLYIDPRAYGPTPWVFVYVRDADPRSPASAGWVYSTYIQPFSCS
jgi:hypothetical protein